MLVDVELAEGEAERAVDVAECALGERLLLLDPVQRRTVEIEEGLPISSLKAEAVDSKIWSLR